MANLLFLRKDGMMVVFGRYSEIYRPQARMRAGKDPGAFPPLFSGKEMSFDKRKAIAV